MTSRRVLLLVSAMALVSPARAWSQSSSTLEGIVRDEGGGVAHAEVIAVDSLTNERRRAETNDRGFYRMLELGPGRYAVTAAILGYTPVTQNIHLVAGERAQLELVLARSTTILPTVSVQERRAYTPAIERMSVSTTLLAEDIQRLPLSSRNVMNLAAVAPGLRSFQPVTGYALPAAGALRGERAINLYVDGVEMKNMNSSNAVGAPQSGTLIPVDAVAEYRVLLDPYDAEYTRGAAYVVSAVTHRGTNEMHGSAFGLFQNRALVSATDFQRGIPNFETPEFDRQQTGVSLRGPVVRNRLFYAASYERSHSNNGVAVVPGQPAGDPGLWDRYAGIFDAPSRNDAGLLRLTYVANEAHVLEAIVAVRRTTGESGFGGIDVSQSAVDQVHAVNTVNLHHRWLPASGLANELSVQFVGWALDQHPIAAGPALRYPTLNIGSGGATAAIHETQFRAIERITYGLGSGPGSHLLKAGLEIGRVAADQFTPTNRDGVFRFRTETSTSPDQATIGVGSSDPYTDHDALTALTGMIAGMYVNDEWLVTPRLVLNLGIRYDAEINTMNNHFTVPWASDTTFASRPELRGLLNRGDRKNDLDNVSPRLSFSWDVTGRRRTFLRGGFAIMYDRIPGFVPFAERGSATWRTYVFTNPGTLDAGELRDRVIAGGGTEVPPAITLLPHRMDVPENRQWSVGLGAQLTNSVTLNADFVHQDVRHLYAPVNLNWLDVSRTPAMRVLSPAYGNVGVWGDFARARYRALLTSVGYDRDSTCRLTLAYTLASALADWDVQTVAVPAQFAGRYYSMQRTSGDERHRVVLSGSWALRHGISLSTITTVASPRPYRTTVGQDLNRDNLLDDDWIDDRRYRVPPNAWRHWYRVVDLRAAKAIDVGHGARLSLIAEAFNLFNAENYSGYFGVLRSATGEPRPDFGSPNGIFATRQLQLGTRLQF